MLELIISDAVLFGLDRIGLAIFSALFGGRRLVFLFFLLIMARRGIVKVVVLARKLRRLGLIVNRLLRLLQLGGLLLIARFGETIVFGTGLRLSLLR